MILVVSLPMLCLVPCPVFVWCPPVLLATGSCYWVGWRLRSLNAAFPCWSCLSYFKKQATYQNYSSRNIGTTLPEKFQNVKTKSTTNATIMSCWTIFNDRKYAIPDWMYVLLIPTNDSHEHAVFILKALNRQIESSYCISGVFNHTF
jgi:hypothetical protein